jgi:hypothetical protein
MPGVLSELATVATTEGVGSRYLGVRQRRTRASPRSSRWRCQANSGAATAFGGLVAGAFAPLGARSSVAAGAKNASPPLAVSVFTPVRPRITCLPARTVTSTRRGFASLSAGLERRIGD